MRETTASSSPERERDITPDVRREAGSRRGWLLWSAQRLLVSGGVAMLAWSAWVVIDASRFQQAARQSLVSATALDAPAAATDPAAVAAAGSIPAGSPVATLTIPRIRLSTVVLHGSDPGTLRRGPGHLENTALPGEPGNIVIAGHRDTFFRPLRRIQIGDTVRLGSARGQFEYRVSSLRVVKANDLSVLEQNSDHLLTLITCYPFTLIGSAPDRFIARATRVTEAGTREVTLRETMPVEFDGPSVAPVPDDRALVRGAIDRFRATYNARLVSHGELAARGRLVLRPCLVAVSRDAATATCGTVEAGEHDQIQTWTFGLARLDGKWTIRSAAID
jgi:sortase A